MAYTTVNFTSRDRHRHYDWQLEAPGVVFRIESEDARTRVVVDFASPESVDQLIGVLTQARNALYDRRAQVSA